MTVEVHKQKLKTTVDCFIKNNIKDETVQLKSEILVDDILSIWESMQNMNYEQLDKIQKQCDNCTYTQAKPLDGTFAEKVSQFIRERSFWINFMWITVCILFTLLGYSYLNIFNSLNDNIKNQSVKIDNIDKNTTENKEALILIVPEVQRLSELHRK